MSVAEKINSIKTHVADAYAGIASKGGTIPTNKNIENLKAAIETISTGDDRPLQAKTVTPTKAQQIVSADPDYSALSQVTVEAIPDEYIIPSGTLEITGNGTYDVSDKASVVVGVSSEKPTLNAPTISLNGATLTITNPATNGNFVTAYKVYDGATLVTTVTTMTVDLSALITTAGTHIITVKASGTNFNDSVASNSVVYTILGLETPVISLVSGTTIQIDTIDDNATTIEVFADGLSIGEVTKEATPLINFSIEGGNYSAEEGMTWGEWVASSYNTANFVIANTNQIQSSTGKYVAVADVRVTTDEAIIANKSYMLSSAVE